jgi:hypothetical protein
MSLSKFYINVFILFYLNRFVKLSIIIRDPVEKLNRSGINCIKYEQNSDRQQIQGDRLFTAGRDSIIRVYTHFDFPQQQQQQQQQFHHNSHLQQNSFNSSSSNSLNDVNAQNYSSDQFYQMSLSHHTDWINDIVVCKKTKTGMS